MSQRWILIGLQDFLHLSTGAEKFASASDHENPDLLLFARFSPNPDHLFFHLSIQGIQPVRPC
jgi:hypothetical protein